MAIANMLGDNARRDPFYSFNRFQQTQGQDMTTSPMVGGPSGYLSQNQDAAYNRYLASLGIGQADMNPFAKYMRDQYSQTQLGYKTALAEDPTLLYQNYLGSIGFTPMYNQFLRLSPQQRGENQGRFVGPTRTIADN